MDRFFVALLLSSLRDLSSKRCKMSEEENKLIGLCSNNLINNQLNESEKIGLYLNIYNIEQYYFLLLVLLNAIIEIDNRNMKVAPPIFYRKIGDYSTTVSSSMNDEVCFLDNSINVTFTSKFYLYLLDKMQLVTASFKEENPDVADYVDVYDCFVKEDRKRVLVLEDYQYAHAYLWYLCQVVKQELKKLTDSKEDSRGIGKGKRLVYQLDVRPKIKSN